MAKSFTRGTVAGMQQTDGNKDETMVTILIDYNRYGRSKQITIPLLVEERGIVAGEQVKIVGDAVPERIATVVAVGDSGRNATLEFHDTI